MSAPVLVAYATRYGSTREVAETVAAALRKEELVVDVVPVAEVRSLECYGPVVLGAPFYIGRLHKDAQRFLDRHRDALAKRPVAVFTLGPVGHGEQEMEEARDQLARLGEDYAWLSPVALEMFGGRYDPSKLGFAHKLLTVLPASPLHGLAASDLRDWGAIESWANGLARRLAPAIA